MDVRSGHGEHLKFLYVGNPFKRVEQDQMDAIEMGHTVRRGRTRVAGRSHQNLHASLFLYPIALWNVAKLTTATFLFLSIPFSSWRTLIVWPGSPCWDPWTPASARGTVRPHLSDRPASRCAQLCPAVQSPRKPSSQFLVINNHQYNIINTIIKCGEVGIHKLVHLRFLICFPPPHMFRLIECLWHASFASTGYDRIYPFISYYYYYSYLIVWAYRKHFFPAASFK